MSKNYAAITVSSNKETRKTYAAKANSPRVLVLPRRRNEHARRRENRLGRKGSAQAGSSNSNQSPKHPV